MRTFAQFKRLIGFKRLAAIHMNDSKPQPVRAWTVMNTSAKEKSGWTHSGISCARRVFATFPKSSRRPRALTWQRMSSISLRCARSCKNPCIRDGTPAILGTPRAEAARGIRSLLRSDGPGGTIPPVHLGKGWFSGSHSNERSPGPCAPKPRYPRMDRTPTRPWVDLECLSQNATIFNIYVLSP
jgi:hypothetical protein